MVELSHCRECCIVNRPWGWNIFTGKSYQEWLKSKEEKDKNEKKEKESKIKIEQRNNKSIFQKSKSKFKKIQ